MRLFHANKVITLQPSKMTCFCGIQTTVCVSTSCGAKPFRPCNNTHLPKRLRGGWVGTAWIVWDIVSFHYTSAPFENKRWRLCLADTLDQGFYHSCSCPKHIRPLSLVTIWPSGANWMEIIMHTHRLEHWKYIWAFPGGSATLQKCSIKNISSRMLQYRPCCYLSVVSIIFSAYARTADKCLVS